MALIKAGFQKTGAKGGWRGGRSNVVQTVVKGGGKGGQWLFIPAGAAIGGKGKGKGKNSVQYNKTMDKLGKMDADKKVWIGGLTKKVTWKKLEKHMEELCGTKPKLTEVMGGGKTGVCAFASADDATAAIGAANGSELEGKAIEVDVWTEKEKKEGEEKPKRKFSATFQKGASKKGDAININSVDSSLKVWVGGLATKTTPAKLKKHFVEGGCEADKVKMLKPGTACVTFETEGDASAAIGAMTGSELDGKTIEVDVWTKSEKKGKKVKEEE